MIIQCYSVLLILWTHRASNDLALSLNCYNSLVEPKGLFQVLTLFGMTMDAVPILSLLKLRSGQISLNSYI